MTSTEKRSLLEMLKTLICQHEGPVQTRDDAIDMWEKHTGDRFYEWEEKYSAMKAA